MPLKIVGLDHIVLRTSNLSAMLAFYQDVLACPLERQLPPEVGLSQLRAGNTLIDIVDVNSELGRLGGTAPSQQNNNLDHFCLQFTGCDLPSLIQHLTAQGVKVGDVAERYGAQGFGQSIYIQDPDGNTLELKAHKPT
ncbi:VOC family virulence protein [Saccharobesus litoralis]|uniref:VOC family virulence protein n=1 Tax=Saccharobesus litoralis TaxID=2172099 RepID=A0A2S0VQM9_9ALTE|nr:VOC family protein [Saccharobesus litoralis]AWB66518.1 VOC family virulence protein [Saccharobesus litoralis]